MAKYCSIKRNNVMDQALKAIRGWLKSSPEDEAIKKAIKDFGLDEQEVSVLKEKLGIKKNSAGKKYCSIKKNGWEVVKTDKEWNVKSPSGQLMIVPGQAAKSKEEAERRMKEMIEGARRIADMKKNDYKGKSHRDTARLLGK